MAQKQELLGIPARPKSPFWKQKGFHLFLMLLPFVFLIFLLNYLPLYSWRLAFYDFKWGRPDELNTFVGLDVFRSLINNQYQFEELMQALKNTFGMSGLHVLTLPLPMFFAIFLHELRGPFRKTVQTLTTIPNFISWVLVFSVACAAFTVDDGFVNRMLIHFGIRDTGIAFLQSENNVWMTMIAWNLWKTMGWSAIMYFASMTNIDPELYDAANVDGAGRWARIRHITIPCLIPTLFVLLVLNIANFVNWGLEQPLVFMNQMNKPHIQTLDVFLVTQGITGRNPATAMAVGILKTFVCLVLVFGANKLSKVVRKESVF
ncbi:MAG: ABC transporter permease subunit [Oscillospiraceae bacterium]|nr:ABC transporter permease subunit [Oscillospiraceae bacterium]